MDISHSPGVWPPVMKASSLTYFLTRSFIGVIFIYAGVTQLGDPASFAVLIDAYGLLPEFVVFPVSVLLPVLEIIAGMGLVFDVNGSLKITTVLLIIFIAVLGYGMSMGLDMDCGCFGADDPEGKAYHGLRTTLYRDILLLSVTAYLFLWRMFR